MQKQILKATTILSLVVALTITFAVAPAAADSFGSIRVDVPFDFTADHSIFPAGKYTIRPAGGNTNGVIRITSEDGKASIFLSTHSAQSVQSKDETVVIFHHYGDQYFLFQVWAVGDTSGLEIPRSSMERQAARAIEANKGHRPGAASPPRSSSPQGNRRDQSNRRISEVPSGALRSHSATIVGNYLLKKSLIFFSHSNQHTAHQKQ